MRFQLKPLGDNILVKQRPPQQVQGRLQLAGDGIKPPPVGTILAVGPDVNPPRQIPPSPGGRARRYPEGLVPGLEVYYQEYAGQFVEMDPRTKERVILLRPAEILALVVGENIDDTEDSDAEEDPDQEATDA